jgi:hypothetical protein
VSRFAASQAPRFGTRAAEAAKPHVGKTMARRFAMLRRAEEAVAVLPGPGESVHCLMTGYYDLMHVIVRLNERLGPFPSLRIATLSYNARNLSEMLALLDGGRVGRLTLLCSSFFRDHNKGLWRQTLDGFRARGQRAAAARSHCKVVCIELGDGGRLVLEGSANLRTNRNREQLAIVRDDSLHGWHSAWIDEVVKAHEAQGHEAAD